MILASHGIIGSQIVQFSGLLDTYTGAAAAYSLRLLRTAYTGYAIKVRRASDNTEQDIGFSNNELDTTTLASFCSGTNGFVTTWYDQSGNGYNATQTTAASQPQIVSSGSTITENGKPSLQFDGTDDHLLTSTTVVTSQQGFAFTVYNPQDGQFAIAQSNSSVQNDAFRLDSDTSTISPKYIRFLEFTSSNNIVGGSTNVFNIQTLATYSSDSSTWRAWVNSIQQTLSIISGTNNGAWFGDHQYRLGIQVLERPTPLYSKAILQELILYPSDQSSNRTGIETNINGFYSIY